MLWEAGVQTVLPPGYLCCGYPQRGSGQYDKAEKIVTDNRVLFHRVANTLNYLDIKTVVVSCGTCYDQLAGYEFDKIFPGCRIIDIHEFLLEKGMKLDGVEGTRYMYHDPCHTPIKTIDPVKLVNELMGSEHDGYKIEKNDRCCGESGTLAVTRPDISTQVGFRKEEEIKKGAAKLRAITVVASAAAADGGADAAPAGGALRRPPLRRAHPTSKSSRAARRACRVCRATMRTPTSRPTTSWSKWRARCSARTGWPTTSIAPTMAESSACWCNSGIRRCRALQESRTWNACFAAKTAAKCC